MILAVMNAIYAIAYIEAWKSQDFNWVSTRDHAIPVRRSNQLSYDALTNWTMKASKPWSSQLWKQFKQLRIEAPTTKSWLFQAYIYAFA